MKRCFKCLRDLPLSEFYRHPAMADGHLSKCRDCTRADVASNRLAKLERVREYDRQRANLPHRKELRQRITREWDEKHPDRARAQQRANNALRGGQIERVTNCEGCGRTGRIEKHHPDYTRAELVIWLCKPCHSIADKIRRRMETGEQEKAS